jgi:hypothetical protein
LSEQSGPAAHDDSRDLVLVDARSLHLRAKVADLLVEAAVEPEAPHRLTELRVFPGGAPATDPRVAQPPAANLGPVPEEVPGLVEDSYAEVGLVGLTAAGDWDSGPAPEVWAFVLTNRLVPVEPVNARLIRSAA